MLSRRVAAEFGASGDPCYNQCGRDAFLLLLLESNSFHMMNSFGFAAALLRCWLGS